MNSRKAETQRKQKKTGRKKHRRILWSRVIVLAAGAAVFCTAVVWAAGFLFIQNKMLSTTEVLSSDSTLQTALNQNESEAENVQQSASEGQIEKLKSFEEQIDAASLADLDSTALDFGFNSSNRDETNKPSSLAYYDSLYNPYGGYTSVPTAEKTVYLTMDEGYENGFTPEILDTLKEKGVHATFFITGQFFDEHPELVQRMIDEGHTVGSHTKDHPDMPEQTLQEQYEQVQSLHNEMIDKFGYEMSLIRFPMGRASVQSVALMQQAGYKSIFWSFAYVDYDTANQPDQTESLEYMVESVHPGAIYLMHAVSETNTKVLGSLIDRLQEQGYSFGTLQDL